MPDTKLDKKPPTITIELTPGCKVTTVASPEMMKWFEDVMLPVFDRVEKVQRERHEDEE